MMRRAADYMDTNPSDYREHQARFGRMTSSTLRHAERMVALGLLTEPQAAVVMQHYLSGGSDGSRPYYLHNENVQQMLGMTAAQKEELIKVEQTATKRELV